jgi:hypothetical protein
VSGVGVDAVDAARDVLAVVPAVAAGDVAAVGRIDRLVTIDVAVDVGIEVVVARETSTAEGETDGRSSWVSSGGVIRTR